MKKILSIENTTSVNGIFILIVFISHLRAYITLPDCLGSGLNYIGQLMVATFLLFSGYGVFSSIHKKGPSYVRSFPSKRILKVLIQFDIAVILYLLINMFLGDFFTYRTILLSLLGWENLGNSNWYIFVILVLYLITWLAFMIVPNNEKAALIVLTILTGFVFIFLHQTKDSFWYNTIFCYPFGMWVGLYGENIITKLSTKRLLGYGCILLTLLGTALLHTMRSRLYFYIPMTLMFCLCVIAIMCQIPFKNPVLFWLGKRLFPIYILMRIPMILMVHFHLFVESAWLFSGISLVITLLLALAFDWCIKKIPIMKK